MKETKTFKAGTSLDDVAHFAKTKADELTGDTGEGAISASVRVTVEVIKADGLAVDPLLSELALDEAAHDVRSFLEYRRDELRKPVRSIKALRRLLSQFRGRPERLVAAIEESSRNGWTGLFLRESVSRDRSIERKGADGGEW